MPPLEFLTPFLLATAVFAFVPGTGMLYAVAQTISCGRRAGWWSAFGFHLAGLFHVTAAALGVSALLAVMPVLFVVMKCVGAAYLVWMGIGYLRQPVARPAASGQAGRRTARQALRDSFLVEIFNPKSVLFFMAFLPQYTDPSATLPVWIQVAMLGLVASALFTLSDAILIELSHLATGAMQASADLATILQKIGGVVLIGLGVRLALAETR